MLAKSREKGAGERTGVCRRGGEGEDGRGMEEEEVRRMEGRGLVTLLWMLLMLLVLLLVLTAVVAAEVVGAAGSGPELVRMLVTVATPVAVCVAVVVAAGTGASLVWLMLPLCLWFGAWTVTSVVRVTESDAARV
jgi:hypothetical protein